MSELKELENALSRTRRELESAAEWCRLAIIAAEDRESTRAVETVRVMEGKPVAGEWYTDDASCPDGDMKRDAGDDSDPLVAHVFYLGGSKRWRWVIHRIASSGYHVAQGHATTRTDAMAAADAWARANPHLLDWQMPPASEPAPREAPACACRHAPNHVGPLDAALGCPCGPSCPCIAVETPAAPTGTARDPSPFCPMPSCQGIVELTAPGGIVHRAQCRKCHAVISGWVGMRIGDSPIVAPPSPPTTEEKPACTDYSPPGFSGHWRDWHRGHGCNLDPDAAKTKPLPRAAKLRYPKSGWRPDCHARFCLNCGDSYEAHLTSGKCPQSSSVTVAAPPPPPAEPRAGEALPSDATLNMLTDDENPTVTPAPAPQMPPDEARLATIDRLLYEAQRATSPQTREDNISTARAQLCDVRSAARHAPAPQPVTPRDGCGHPVGEHDAHGCRWGCSPRQCAESFAVPERTTVGDVVANGGFSAVGLAAAVSAAEGAPQPVSGEVALSPSGAMAMIRWAAGYLKHTAKMEAQAADVYRALAVVERMAVENTATLYWMNNARRLEGLYTGARAEAATLRARVAELEARAEEARNDVIAELIEGVAEIGCIYGGDVKEPQITGREEVTAGLEKLREMLGGGR